MKVILLQTVPKLGKAGTVVNVADGYARNFLFTRKLAIFADRKQIAALEKRHAKVAEKTAGEKTSAEALKADLDGKSVRIEAKVGRDSTRLFGAVTTQDVADAIKSQLGHDIERKRIGLLEPIRRLGSYPVDLDLHREVDAHITVEVFDPNAPVEAPKLEQAPEQTAEEPQAVEA
jgi:large subunit ribosomal protein L9